MKTLNVMSGLDDGVMTDAELWAGIYGIHYTTKFTVDWKQRADFMRHILSKTGARSIVDVGCNAGWNLMALRTVDESLNLMGVEINHHVAVSACSVGLDVVVGAAHVVGPLFPEKHDLAMTSGLLIHIPPHLIKQTMASISLTSKEWVLAVEYEADEEKVLRQHENHPPRIWARPYGKMYEELGLVLVEEGDPGPAYTDCHYWLFRKGALK